jgi:hypothetical protein
MPRGCRSTSFNVPPPPPPPPPMDTIFPRLSRKLDLPRCLVDKQNAWKESWKALEDIYNSKEESYPGVASIGVANFKNGDMKTLMDESRIRPHMVQLNVWSLLHDPTTVNLCNQYTNAHMQVFDVMNGILSPAKEAPHASGHLRKVAHELLAAAEPLTTSQVVFKSLSQYKISALQREADLTIHDILDLSEAHLKEVGHAIETILSGSNMEDDVHVQITFHAKDQDMVLFYYPGPNDEVPHSFQRLVPNPTGASHGKE